MPSLSLSTLLLALPLVSSALATAPFADPSKSHFLAKREFQYVPHEPTSTPLYIDGLKITDVVAFGDSMTDSGNMLARTQGQRPAPPNWKGRYSDGPTWIEYFVQCAGLNLRNHAFAGARTDYFGAASYIPAPGVTDAFNVDYLGYFRQIPEYLDSLKRRPAASVAHVVYIGALDYIPFIMQGTVVFSNTLIRILTSIAVSNTINGLEQLYDAGARTFVVLGQPNAKEVPITDLIRKDYGQKIGDDVSDTIKKIVSTHNRKLIVALDAFKQKKGANCRVKYVDMISGPRQDEIDNRPVPRAPCVMPATGSGRPASYLSYISGLVVGLGEPLVCYNPQDYIFWDLIHPTTYVHNIIAKNVIQQINSTTVTGLIYAPSADKISKASTQYIVADADGPDAAVVPATSVPATGIIATGPAVATSAQMPRAVTGFGLAAFVGMIGLIACL